MNDEPNKVNDGGPAFPLPMVLDAQGVVIDTEEYSAGNVGMTLRDYFAGQAMNGQYAGENDLGLMETAKYAYEIADAMLAERERKAQE